MRTQADLAVMSELSDHGRDSRECGHYASTELASDPAAAAEARRFTRARLPLWGMEALTEDAVAVVSELAANAGAPRGALSYPRCSRDELEGGSWV
jgi:hypothetical protein